MIADAFGLDAAIWTLAALTAASGLVVAVRKYEAHRRAEPRATTEARPVLKTALSTSR